MRILSTDVVGAGQTVNVSSALQAAGYKLTPPLFAYCMIFVENSQGSTAARVGGSNVGASVGVPLSQTGYMTLPPVYGGTSGLPPKMWDMTITYMWIPTGDTISVNVWCD